MLVSMTKVRVVGPRRRLDEVLEELHRLGVAEIGEAARSTTDGALGRLDGDDLRTERRDELRFLLAEIDALLALLPARAPHPFDAEDQVPGAVDAPVIRTLVEGLTPAVEGLTARLDALRDEEVVLPRYLEPLRRLVQLVPELADLGDDDLAALRLDTVAVVLNTEDERVVETLRDELAARLGTRFELVWTRVEQGAIGCVVVFPHNATETVHALLGREHVRHVALPSQYERLSLRGAVQAMERRLVDLPGAVAAVEDERSAVLTPHEVELRRLRAGIRAELEQLDAHRRLVATRRTFVAHLWLPRTDLPALRRELEIRVGPEVVIEELETAARDAEAPVLLRNPGFARPLEPLVRFLDVPHAGSFDPTILTALFLPLMFGVMVGDVGYGALLLLLGLVLRRRLAGRSPVAGSVAHVLVVGSAWSILFGVLFGELFGDLGKRAFGDWALWMYRPGAEALEPLLLFAIAIGAAHVVLGVLIGAWQAARFRRHRVLLDKVGTLLVLAGVFGLAGWAADRLPGAALTPAAAAVVVGLVLIMSLHGALGVIMGPIELIGTLGNVLSYLRLAAVGLASAYLAIVANELAVAGPIWMGVLVGAFFHALNLALAAFSPTIQALRLHYVEFFSKFLEGGGRPFRPFGGRADL